MKPEILHLLRRTAIAVLGTVIITLLPGCQRAKPNLAIKVFIDGSDVIKISGTKLWIEHLSASLPGSTIYINGRVWMPQWDDKTSAPFDALDPAFAPQDPQKIKVSILTGRGTVTVTDLPTAANNQTLSFKIDDEQFGGADWYEVLVFW